MGDLDCISLADLDSNTYSGALEYAHRAMLVTTNGQFEGAPEYRDLDLNSPLLCAFCFHCLVYWHNQNGNGACQPPEDVVDERQDWHDWYQRFHDLLDHKIDCRSVPPQAANMQPCFNDCCKFFRLFPEYVERCYSQSCRICAYAFS